MTSDLKALIKLILRKMLTNIDTVYLEVPISGSSFNQELLVNACFSLGGVTYAFFQTKLRFCSQHHDDTSENVIKNNNSLKCTTHFFFNQAV